MNGREFDFPDSFEAATLKALAGPDVEMRGIQFDPAYTSLFEEIVDQSLKRFLADTCTAHIGGAENNTDSSPLVSSTVKELITHETHRLDSV